MSAWSGPGEPARAGGHVPTRDRPDGADHLAVTVADLAGPAGATWSVCVRDVGTGRVLASSAPDRQLPIASVGKLLLLVEVAARFADGTLDPGSRLHRRAELEVGDSGLWQHLATEALPAGDLAVLVAAVSDNLATNVLLDHVGLPAVHRRGEALGLTATRLLDRVRDRRDADATEGDPEDGAPVAHGGGQGAVGGADVAHTLAVGTAAELSGLLARLALGTAVGPEPDAMVVGWLGLGVDLSMVGSAFGLDPLAHQPGDGEVLLRCKTGSDPGTRADVGLVGRGGRQLAYAAIARWDPADDAPRDAVLAGMRRLGAGLRATLDTADAVPDEDG